MLAALHSSSRRSASQLRTSQLRRCLHASSRSAVPYALGTAANELQRLLIQHNVFAAETRRVYKSYSFGQTVLDCGCGPGANTLELAELVGPSGTVVAVDSSSDGLRLLWDRAVKRGYYTSETPSDAVIDLRHDELRSIDGVVLRHDELGSVLLRLADAAGDALLLPGGGTVDHVWCRWLLTWLDGKDAVPAALRNMHAIVRPGGTISIWDYFDDSVFGVESGSRVPCPVWNRVRDRLLEEWHRVGDPCVAAKIPSMLATLKGGGGGASEEGGGFEITQVTPIAPIILAGSADWVWPTTYFAVQVRRLRALGLFTDDEVSAMDREWADLTNCPGAFYCPPTMAVITARRKA